MHAEEIDRLWAEYLAARDRAERSRDIADGIAAGRAWAAFLRAFEGRTPLLRLVEGRGK